jgi:hypothetical protein
MRILYSLAALTAAAVSALPQTALHSAQTGILAPGSEKTAAKREQLGCYVDTKKPFVDFAFRFEAGYVVHCPLREFQGQASKLLAYLRVRPEGALPIILGEGYRLPGIPPVLRSRIDLHHFNTEIEFSGVFAVGEGEYPVELVLADDHNRYCERRWKVRAAHSRSDEAIPVSMKPNTAAPIAIPRWDEQQAAPGKRLRVTVLLDAAPIDPASLKLRAWDRAFLLDSLFSLLRQLPSDSVRVVAFNLDQQRELFRQDRFDGLGFSKLSQALQDVELGTVSYRVLERQQGWSELLAGLVNAEVSAKDPPDAVIFLGPATRITRRVPEELLTARTTQKPQFFYFEYFPTAGNDYPDALHHLTSACNGKVFRIHSPGELAQGIQKMQEQLKQIASTAAIE